MINIPPLFIVFHQIMTSCHGLVVRHGTIEHCGMSLPPAFLWALVIMYHLFSHDWLVQFSLANVHKVDLNKQHHFYVIFVHQVYLFVRYFVIDILVYFVVKTLLNTQILQQFRHANCMIFAFTQYMIAFTLYDYLCTVGLHLHCRITFTL